MAARRVNCAIMSNWPRLCTRGHVSPLPRRDGRGTDLPVTPDNPPQTLVKDGEPTCRRGSGQGYAATCGYGRRVGDMPRPALRGATPEIRWFVGHEGLRRDSLGPLHLLHLYPQGGHLPLSPRTTVRSSTGSGSQRSLLLGQGRDAPGHRQGDGDVQVGSVEGAGRDEGAASEALGRLATLPDR